MGEIFPQFMHWVFSPEPSLWIAAVGIGGGLTLALAPQIRNIRLAHAFFAFAWIWSFGCAIEEIINMKIPLRVSLPLAFIIAGTIGVLAVLSHLWVERNHIETSAVSGRENLPMPSPAQPIAQPEAHVSPTHSNPTKQEHTNHPVSKSVPKPVTPVHEPNNPQVSPQGPPPIQNVRIVSQGWVSSTKPEYLYDLRLVIQTNVVINPPSFIFDCDAPIAAGEWSFAGNGPMMIMENWSQVLPNSRGYLLAFRSPAFTPEQNIVVNLYSKTAFRLVAFGQAPFPTQADIRPFPGQN